MVKRRLIRFGILLLALILLLVPCVGPADRSGKTAKSQGNFSLEQIPPIFSIF